MDRRGFLLGASALAFAPRIRRERSLRPVALVTADLESRLVVVDLPGGRVRRHVATLPYPRSIERVGRAALVAHSEIGAVTIVDTPSLLIRRVLHDFSEPRYTAAHPDGRHAYVTDARRGEVVALDVHAARVLGRARVGLRARHVSIDPAGRMLWVALGTRADEIAVVDVFDRGRPRLVRRFRPPFLAHDVGFAPDGRRAWVSSGDRNQLAVYDTRTAACWRGRTATRRRSTSPSPAGSSTSRAAGAGRSACTAPTAARSAAPSSRSAPTTSRTRSAGSSRPRSAAAI